MRFPEICESWILYEETCVSTAGVSIRIGMEISMPLDVLGIYIFFFLFSFFFGGGGVGGGDPWGD